MEHKRTISIIVAVIFSILALGSYEDEKKEENLNKSGDLSSVETIKKISGCWSVKEIGDKDCFEPTTKKFTSYHFHDLSRPALEGSFSISGNTIDIDARYASTPQFIKYNMVGEIQPYKWKIIQIINDNKMKVHWYNTHPNPSYQSNNVKIYERVQ